MTNRERAWGIYLGTGGTAERVDAIELVLDEAVAEARAEEREACCILNDSALVNERERCARIADKHARGGEYGRAACMISDEIRGLVTCEECGKQRSVELTTCDKCAENDAFDDDNARLSRFYGGDL